MHTKCNVQNMDMEDVECGRWSPHCIRRTRMISMRRNCAIENRKWICSFAASIMPTADMQLRKMMCELQSTDIGHSHNSLNSMFIYLAAFRRSHKIYGVENRIDVLSAAVSLVRVRFCMIIL